MKRIWTTMLAVGFGWWTMGQTANAQMKDTVSPDQDATAAEGGDTKEAAAATPENDSGDGTTTQGSSSTDEASSAQTDSSSAKTAEGPETTALGTPLTLEEALEQALRNHPSFKNIDEVVYQADMGIYQAWTMLMPYLSAEAQITLNQSKVSVDIPMGPVDMTDPTGEQQVMSLTIQDQWAKSFGFAANLTLFNPQTIPIIKMAYDVYEKSKLTAQIQRNDLLFAVTSAFYQAYAMKEMIEVARENVAMAEEFLRHATILKSAGQSTRIDVNRAEIQLVEAEKELETAIDAEKKALLTLKQLIHAREAFTLVGPGSVQQVETPIESLKNSAVENRTEFKEAALAEKIADRNRQHTLTKFLPKFDMTYSWSWASAEGFTGSNINWMLIFGAKWDLFLGGSRAVEYKVRQSEIRMAKNSIEQITLDIQSDVEQKHLDMQKRQRNIDILDRQVSLADENYTLVSKQFQAGLVSSLDVVNASTELRNVRVLRVYERLLFDLAVLTLRKAIGEYSSLSFVPAG